jgi:hypothetical protein
VREGPQQDIVPLAVYKIPHGKEIGDISQFIRQALMLSGPLDPANVHAIPYDVESAGRLRECGAALLSEMRRACDDRVRLAEHPMPESSNEASGLGRLEDIRPVDRHQDAAPEDAQVAQQEEHHGPQSWIMHVDHGHIMSTKEARDHNERGGQHQRERSSRP